MIHSLDTRPNLEGLDELADSIQLPKGCDHIRIGQPEPGNYIWCSTAHRWSQVVKPRMGVIHLVAEKLVTWVPTIGKLYLFSNFALYPGDKKVGYYVDRSIDEYGAWVYYFTSTYGSKEIKQATLIELLDQDALGG